MILCSLLGAGRGLISGFLGERDTRKIAAITKRQSPVAKNVKDRFFKSLSSLKKIFKNEVYLLYCGIIVGDCQNGEYLT